jgi:fructose-specific phosphotransferase system component IIB
MPNMVKPPENWRPELKGCARAWNWQRAAGFDADGVDKSRDQHKSARSYIKQKELLRVIDLKDMKDMTNEEKTFVAKCATWATNGTNRGRSKKVTYDKAIDSANETPEHERTDAERNLLQADSTKRSNKNDQGKIYRALPGVSEAMKAAKKIYNAIPKNIVRRMEHQEATQLARFKKKSERLEVFLRKNEIQFNSERLSHRDAFNFVLELIFDKHSNVGKDIFDKLGGMTLYDAFWEGKFNGAMYALMSRGCAETGGSTAESIRFLTNNQRSATAITHPNGSDFKYTDQEFEDLQLVYCPVRVFDNYADVSTLESAFQIFFDYLQVGRHRLWLKSGTGCSKLTHRKSDMRYMERTKDMTPKFVFGITILKNISVLEQVTDENGKNRIVEITAGLGTRCKVTHRVWSRAIYTKEQLEACTCAHATLPANFMERAARKRKVDVVDEMETGGDDGVDDDSSEEEVLSSDDSDACEVDEQQ